MASERQPRARIHLTRPGNPCYPDPARTGGRRPGVAGQERAVPGEGTGVASRSLVTRSGPEATPPSFPYSGKTSSRLPSWLHQC